MGFYLSATTNTRTGTYRTTLILYMIPGQPGKTTFTYIFELQLDKIDHNFHAVKFRNKFTISRGLINIGGGL